MFYATVGVNDLVFMPPGFVFVEKVAASSDSFGARLAVLSTLASPCEAAQRLSYVVAEFQEQQRDAVSRR